MESTGLGALLLTKPANMQYLLGDGRLCAFAAIARDGRSIVGAPSTDFADVTALARCDHVLAFEDEVGMIHAIAHALEILGVRDGTIGLEYSFLTQSMMAMVTHPHAKPAAVGVADATSILSSLRMVKDDDEVRHIAAAAKVAVAGMTAAVAAVRPGLTESQVAGAAELAMREQGASEFWRTYVSSGPRTNLAHGIPTLRRLETGDLVMIDVHPIVEGYSADICRTVCVGSPNADQRAAYDAYLSAQQATIRMARAGVAMLDLEQAMHGILRGAGHGDHIFGPPIHGVGIEFEEAPLPPGHAFFHGEAAPPPLPAGVVLAVGNCGLYAGPWGVRVEDTIVVGADGPTILTDFRRNLTP
jgi:Xaa-Pro aminopeptidase